MPGRLLQFIREKMQMSHVYQPVMLRKLLSHGGRATEREIAQEILAHDESQIEYYEKVVRDMVGRVLRRHGIVARDRATKSYELVDVGALSSEDMREAMSELDGALKSFLEMRKSDVWKHRKASSGYISGTLRYEVLKGAKTRCELCGVSNDERALEVDHIIPRARGGTDDLFNLQALCYSCNAMKRDRDDTDFRAVRSSYGDREDGCPFCNIDPSRVVAENALGYSILDGFPVTERHTLVISKRHTPSFFNLNRPERNACLQLLDDARGRLIEEEPGLQDFTIGVNDGPAAGQTIGHCHFHLIPRRAGDVEYARGGIRNVLPGRGDY